ncbi:MAG: ACP S-malonyltransferase [Myxococcales bacterium]|jgi:[acyl-carrier-protein] S-malonyltransferase|nr:ACP S-malonyltransferase [Myxococcales bacterium]MBL0193319.1 ACP S-malonyltransferase [Myxococcales bacterium]HQY60730.1 ACP S-malonyltransferase [Polyangiaceae bacterium]
MTTPIFMFPGQSSRYPELLSRLRGSAPDELAATLGEASSALGRDLEVHYRADNAAMFVTNRDVQVGVFLANHVHLLALERRGVRAPLSLGLSLGEYNHLVHVGALGFVEALQLVDARGTLYDAGPRGEMLSVFPLPLAELEEVVARAREHGVVEISGYNSPSQHVLAGEPAALAAASDIVREQLGGECVTIERHLPMHSSLFEPVGAALAPLLQAARWRAPRLPYLPNVLGAIEPAPTPARLVELLTLHVYRPVLWRASIEAALRRYPDATFVEVGPRAVLHNLLTKRWVSAKRLRTDLDTPDHYDALAKELCGSL